MITYKLSLTIGASTNDKPLVIKCHDTGFNIRVSLFVRRIGEWQDEMERYSIPAGATAVLKITKPDDTFCVSDGVIESNKIFFAIPPQAFTVAGEAKAEVSIYGNDGRRVTSATFCIDVPQECVCEGAEQSEPYVDIVGQQVAQAIDAANRAEEAAKRAEEAGGSGGAGEAGGYYSPEVSQPTADTMLVSFTPRAEDMPTVPDVTVTLPAGPAGPAGADGKDGAAGADGKDGAPGPAGPKGDPYTLTESDKQSIVDAVLDALPAAEGVAY